MSAAVDRVLGALRTTGREPRKAGAGWAVRCPAHDDRSPSLSVGTGDDGRVLLRCHAGCSVDAVVAALGLNLADLFDDVPGSGARVHPPRAQEAPSSPGPRRPEEAPEPTREAGRTSWEILDDEGRHVATHVRLDLVGERTGDRSKRIWWEGPDGSKGLPEGLRSADLPLYGAEALGAKPGERVVVCEGEKAADALRRRGILALGTVTGASSTPGAASLEPLRGRPVVLWADNDEPGREHMRRIGAALRAIQAEVSMVRWDEAPPKGDAADWEGTPEALAALLQGAEPWEEFAGRAPEGSEGLTELTELPSNLNSVSCVRGFEGSGPDFGPLAPLPAELPRPPFPAEVLPGWMLRWVEAEAEALQCPEDLPAVLALTVLATAAAGKRQVRVNEGYVEPLNLYATVALPSGEKKSPAFRHALAPLREWEADERRRVSPERDRALARRKTLEKRLEAAQRKAAEGSGGSLTDVDAAAEALARHAVPALPQLTAEDVTPDRMGMLLAEQGGRLAVFSDEGAPFQILAGRYSEKGANVELFNKAHAGTPYICDRVTRDGARIERPTLTFGLAVQPSVVADLAATRSFRGTGSLARILFSMPVSRLGERNPDPRPVPLEVTAEYARNVRALLELHAERDEGGEYVPQTLSLDPAARALLVAFRAEIEPRLGERGDLRPMADWANKAPGTVVRLAGLLHLAGRSHADPGDLGAPVSAEAVEGAILLVRYFVDHARIAFDLMESTPETKHIRALSRWLRVHRPAQVTVREVQRGLSLAEAEQARSALEALAEHGYVQRLESRVPSKAGRPQSEVYAVNPETWAAATGREAGQLGGAA